MGPRSNLVQELERFVAGIPRESLATVMHVGGIMRFIPVNETTIEAKHARVSLQMGKHAIGEVLVSLSNRLPLLD